uniref:Uncharacterized protein n=1 Tax=Manihot esculenta TaxID=3983 RepID=A0A2C9VG48_MANES
MFSPFLLSLDALSFLMVMESNFLRQNKIWYPNQGEQCTARLLLCSRS